MRLLIFTDLHGEKKALDAIEKKSSKADLLLCAGDLTVFEHNMKKLVFWLHNLKKNVLIVHGNHESADLLRIECLKYKNVFFIHKDFFEIERVVFAGYGGGGFSLRDSSFEFFSKRIKSFSKGKKVVLLLHGPPYGNKTDLIYKNHVGNKSYSDFIKKEVPELVVCGHLHDNSRVSDKIGKTLVINPGPFGKLIDL
jgi:Icc-related predicted phosphoesterase